MVSGLGSSALMQSLPHQGLLPAEVGTQSMERGTTVLQIDQEHNLHWDLFWV